MSFCFVHDAEKTSLSYDFETVHKVLLYLFAVFACLCQLKKAFCRLCVSLSTLSIFLPSSRVFVCLYVSFSTLNIFLPSSRVFVCLCVSLPASNDVFLPSLRVFVCLCVSLRVFAHLCPSLRVFV